MKTISVFSEKGGSGKTSLSLATGAYLRRKGEKVLFVDMDSRCDLTSAFGIDPEHTLSTAHICRGAADAYICVIKTPYGDVIPASEELINPDVFRAAGSRKQLARALKALEEDYNYCIIDCPPSIDNRSISALLASDAVIVPMTPERFSYNSMLQFLRTLKAVQEEHPIQFLGFVINRYDNRSSLHRAMQELMQRKALENGTKVYTPPIPNSTSVSKAQAIYCPDLWEYDKRSKAADALNQLLIQIEGDMK